MFNPLLSEIKQAMDKIGVSLGDKVCVTVTQVIRVMHNVDGIHKERTELDCNLFQ